MSEAAKGPGETYYHVSTDGDISCVRWGDPAWTTALVRREDLTPYRVASLLRSAYLAGYEDRGVAVRDVLGIADNPQQRCRK